MVLPRTLRWCCVTELSAFGRRIHWSFLSPLMSILHNADSEAIGAAGLPDPSSAGAGSAAYAAPLRPSRANTPKDRQLDIFSSLFALVLRADSRRRAYTTGTSRAASRER